MNWAGYPASNDGRLRSGAPHWANGIDPESNQTSITSGARTVLSPHSGQGNVTSSTYGRCGSSADRSRPARPPSSSRDPTQVTCCDGHSQTGSGVPQYRVLDSAQSTLLRSHSPYRPCLMVGGCQLVFSFSASSWSFTRVVLMYQDGSA